MVRRAGARLQGGWLATGPIRPGIRLPAQCGVFLVGNAAGEAHPVVAEGISMAMQAAWLLARTFLASRGGPRSRGRTGWLAEAAASVPPVVWGIGTLAVSRVSQLVSQSAWVGSGKPATDWAFRPGRGTTRQPGDFSRRAATGAPITWRW